MHFEMIREIVGMCVSDGVSTIYVISDIVDTSSHVSDGRARAATKKDTIPTT